MKIIYLFFFLLIANANLVAQAKFNSRQSGNWNDPKIWYMSSGEDEDKIPDSNDDVSLLEGDSIVVTNNQGVNNLFLRSAYITNLQLFGATLSVYGTITGSDEGFTNIPIRTDSTGSIRFVGGSRDYLFKLWSTAPKNTPWLWNVEIALDNGAYSSLVYLRASNIHFISGTTYANTIYVDSSVTENGTGVILIDKNATLSFGNSIGGTDYFYSDETYCRSITVNGTLVSTYNGYISAKDIIISGRLVVQYGYGLKSHPNGEGVNEFTYLKGSVLESSSQYMGDEINRSTLPNPIIDTLILKPDLQFSLPMVRILNDTCFANNLQFARKGNLYLWTNSRLVLSPNPTITGQDNSKYIITAPGDVLIKSVSNTEIEVPIGPSVTEYNPVKIKNDGIPDDFTFISAWFLPTCIDSTHQTSVNRHWQIGEAIEGGSNVTLSLGYSDTANRGYLYEPKKAKIVHCDGDYSNYNNGNGETDSVPYYVTGTGFTQFSEFGITSNETVLPLAFIQTFTSHIQLTNVVLDWTVNGTSSFVIMELEKSVGNTSNFQSIYKITADANRYKSPFQYIDFKATGNDSYYRIKITDQNGSVSYSRILNVMNDEKGIHVSLYQNPIIGQLAKFTIASDRSTNIQVYITNAQGKLVEKGNFKINEGSTFINMDIGGIQNGIYFIRCVESGSLIGSFKMIK